MKNKLLTLIICTALAVGSIFAISTAAESAEVVNDVEIETENAYNTAISVDNVGSEFQTDGNSEQNVEKSENLFETIYTEIRAYAAEIISAMTLIGTLIIGVAYKKGLLPLLTRAISAIQTSLGKIKEGAQSEAESTKSSIDAISERICSMENSIAIFSETLGALETKLSSEIEYASERKRISTIIGSQVDMLYDIFMSSALPQYQKDAVGTRIQSMREELVGYAKTEE